MSKPVFDKSFSLYELVSVALGLQRERPLNRLGDPATREQRIIGEASHGGRRGETSPRHPWNNIGR